VTRHASARDAGTIRRFMVLSLRSPPLNGVAD
jgi:hypothetical protein